MSWTRAAQPQRDDSRVFIFLLTGAVILVAAYAFTPPAQLSNRLPRRPLDRSDQSLPSSNLPPTDPGPETDPSTTPPQPTSAPAGPPTQWTRFSAAEFAKDSKYHLLLCATGSVAAIKIPAICGALSIYSNLAVRVLLSQSATRFLDGQSAEQPHWSTLTKIKNVMGVYVDRYEWSKPWQRGDDILHIELRRWADLMVVAPLSANALAKMANGLSDNLVMSVIRAWDTTGQIDGVRPGVALEGGAEKKRIMVAPAMNTAMWRHPVTMKHLRVLVDEWGFENGGWVEVLQPIEKGLACGDAGSGGMKEWKTIVGDIERNFPSLKKDEAAESEGVT